MAKKKSGPDMTSVLDALVGDADRITQDDLSAETSALASPPAAEAAVDADADADPAPKPEPAKPAPAEAKPEADVDEPPTKLSPAQERIRELIRERDEARREATERREQWARVEERTRLVSEANRMREAQEARAAEAERRAHERPDAKVDPTGAELYDLREQVRSLREEQTQRVEQFTREAAQTRQISEAQAFGTALQADLAAFRSRINDYDEAAQYATQVRVNMWKRLGKSDQEAFDLTQAEALAIARSALQAGLSPANEYYDYAKLWGWQPKANGKKAEPVVKPKEKLEQVRKGQQFVGFGDRPNAGDGDDTDIENLSAAQIASLPDDTFLGMLEDPRTAARLQKRLEVLELA